MQYARVVRRPSPSCTASERGVTTRRGVRWPPRWARGVFVSKRHPPIHSGAHFVSPAPNLLAQRDGPGEFIRRLPSGSRKKPSLPRGSDNLRGHGPSACPSDAAPAHFGVCPIPRRDRTFSKKPITASCSTI